MGLTDLVSPAELDAFLKEHKVCLVTFSAHWCGPCRASKPQLEQLAKDLNHIPFGYTYESDLGDYLHTFQIKAFPTYACFVAGKEAQRVEGVNFAAIQEMLSKHASSANAMPETGGHSLGGGGESSKLSPEEARKLRLARLEAASPAKPAAAEEEKPAAKPTEETTPTPMETEEPAGAKEDATMTEAAAEEPTCKVVTNPVDNLDANLLKTLIEEMGFNKLRAQKGLLFSSQGTVESAVEWLMEHQDDADIDEPIPDGSGQEKAQSYKCNECGKILSNMANLELHANKTGHSDFEESTQAVKPLTPEEKAAKIAEIKELLKAKRAEREEAEKVDHVEREKQRRFMGKEMAKTREQMEMEQRKRDALARKKEKQAEKRERERIRKELEKDKLERKANKGKLQSKLGVEGYNPDAIQYDEDEGEEEPATQKPKRSHTASAARIDEYIEKISSYRAGGDGGKCLKILKAYVGNVADNPTEEKFKTINMENKAFKTKVKPFVGAKQLLMAIGFGPKQGDPTFLCLSEDADPQLLSDTRTKLEKALAAYG